MQTSEELGLLGIQDPEFITSSVITLPDVERGNILARIADELLERYVQTESIDDVARAIVLYEQSLALTPNDNPDDYARRLSNLGIALQSRFERTQSLEDLDRALKTKEQALTLTPKDHPNRVVRLDSFGTVVCRVDLSDRD